MMYLRSALSFDDPDNLYNYLKESQVLKDAKLTPEDFGVFHPVADAYRNSSREELLSVITNLIIQTQKGL